MGIGAVTHCGQTPASSDGRIDAPRPASPGALQRTRVICVVDVVLSLASGLPAAALADPMRPLSALPRESLSVLSGPSSGTASPGPAGSPADRAGHTSSAPDRLVALRRDSQGRWQALFGERWVAPGDRIDGLAVSAIDGNSVQMGNGLSRRVLHLLPVLQAPTSGLSSSKSDERPPAARNP